METKWRNTQAIKIRVSLSKAAPRSRDGGYVEIRFGDEKFMYVAEIDAGCTFDLKCSRLIVDHGSDIKVAIQEHPQNALDRVTRTFYIDGLAPNKSKKVLVPAFSTSLLPITSSGVRLDMIDSLGKTRVSIEFLSDGIEQTSSVIPIPNNIISIDVFNFSTKLTNVQLGFMLSL